ncbi:unnamed protein product [Zymoseptoria tritici ST99CH_3D1]|nr:unnamed protein product [Zymoseptoria tritici ST99CH_1E4]SMR47335.1 unnamed protein product [Zymoseptoria tritici ST99CH_3D1]
MGTVLCRNGPQCRKFQEGTCHYNHDFTSMPPNGLSALKKSLNVESPAFTPKSPNVQPAKTVLMSPKAAIAATFTPRGSGTVTPAPYSHSKEPSNEFVPSQGLQPAAQFQEFVPGQSFLASPQLEPESVAIQQQINPYSDPFLAQQGLSGLDGTQAHINPYSQQGGAVGGQAFFQDASSFKHPLNYHLYASVGPRRENLATYQRSTADFFIPDNLREELQRASEATLQTFANSTLPHTIEHFHSLVALDTNSAKGPTTFGYPSWIYKATSSKDGHTYALRRIEGFRLSSEASIRTVNSWKRIHNASLVQIHDAFTGRWFGDSSLIIVTDYHPRSQTLAEKHLAAGRHPHRPGGQITPENELWGYIVQLSSALKTIHEGGLAAQTVVASKVLVTSKNRLRINGCGILDILQHEQKRPLHELQRADLRDLGRLILGIATRNMSAHQNLPKALELVSRSYSERLRSCIAWLLVPPPISQEGKPAEKTTAHSTEYNINSLLTSIADKVVSTLDSALHQEDDITSNLMQELENGRLVRLLTKLNVILERPDTTSTPTASSNPALLNQPSAAWSETGERYYLKLFRDYVFHQVDHEGRPVLDLGHIITCLNKLDAGIDEKFQLVSRDEQSIFITSYKEVKRGFEAAWSEISKASNPARR